MTDRIVALIDMDCFYCQVESRANPDLRGKPMAVVQYNTWKGGGIIAVSYEARAFGVSRNMRGDEAKEKCPDIRLVSVPEVREKADLGKYRDAGKEVIDTLLTFGAVVERASIDEAYIDITKVVEERMTTLSKVDMEMMPNTFVVGFKEEKKRWLERCYDEGRSDDIRLAVGGVIVEEMRKAVFDKTKFRCSAGIAHNKMLGKLACGIHKPNKQTILPHESVPELFNTLKITKLRGFGGKLGESVREDLSVETVGDLAKLSLSRIRERFDEKTANWLFNVAKGLDYEPVKERDLPKSIGCSKNFLGPKMLDTREKVEFWFGQLAEEVCERLEKDRETNGRVARGMTVHISMDGKGSVTRAGNLSGYDPAKMARHAVALVGSLNEASKNDPSLWRPKLRNLSISASKFHEDSGSSSIQNFFGKAASDQPKSGCSKEEVSVEDLVPDLESFDESILEILPPKMKDKVQKRLTELRNEAGVSVSEATTRLEDEKVITERENEASEMVKCDKCPKMVSPFDLPEHLDFHLAQDLQKELRREDAATMTNQAPVVKTVVKTVVINKTNKRKKDEKKDARKKQKNITSFFTKQ